MKIDAKKRVNQNPKALASLKKGCEDIKAGRVTELKRDFSKFLRRERAQKKT